MHTKIKVQVFQDLYWNNPRDPRSTRTLTIPTETIQRPQAETKVAHGKIFLYPESGCQNLCSPLLHSRSHWGCVHSPPGCHRVACPAHSTDSAPTKELWLLTTGSNLRIPLLALLLLLVLTFPLVLFFILFWWGDAGNGIQRHNLLSNYITGLQFSFYWTSVACDIWYAFTLTYMKLLWNVLDI